MDTSEKVPRTRPVILMDAVPARADRPSIGEKTTIITFAHADEIESPLMLGLSDTKKLAVSLIGILAHHGDKKADEVFDRYFADADEDDDEAENGLPSQIDWHAHQQAVDPEMLAAAIYGRPAGTHGLGPHQVTVPAHLIAEWVRVRECDRCPGRFTAVDIRLLDIFRAHGRWLIRYEATCPHCHRQQVMSCALWEPRQPDPHQITVPPEVIGDWLHGATCVSCEEPLIASDARLSEFVFLARKWNTRWEIKCSRCGHGHKLTVATLPRRVRPR